MYKGPGWIQAMQPKAIRGDTSALPTQFFAASGTKLNRLRSNLCAHLSLPILKFHPSRRYFLLTHIRLLSIYKLRSSANRLLTALCNQLHHSFQYVLVFGPMRPYTPASLHPTSQRGLQQEGVLSTAVEQLHLDCLSKLHA